MENNDRVTYFAATDSRGKRTPFGIKPLDRLRHVYVIGKTGMGKSTLLENMAIQDIQNGEGLAFIDPHGGTADKLLDYVPKERINDVVYFAPFDLDQPIAFNVMEDVGYDKRHLVVSGLMATFKKIWVDAWSARMEYILSNTLLALLEYPDATLLSVNRMYTDKGYRKKVVENVKDPVVKDFWVKEFANYGDRYTQEATPAIQNKIGQFTSNPLIRNIIGQPKSTFDIRTLMDQKKILIINLSKGQVGETNMRLLGSMLTTRIFLAAMSRADLSGAEINKLPPFYFYVDEFQNFANDTFAEILSEARKYKLGLLIAHQYVEQMEEQVRAAVFGNVGTTISFRVGPFDAETLETVFSPEFTKEDLVNLTFAQVYLSLMINGVGSRPFSAITLPPIEPPRVSTRNEVIAASRNQFGSTRSVIEQAIMTELTTQHDEGPPEPNAKSGSSKSAGKNDSWKDRAATKKPTSTGTFNTSPRASSVHQSEQALIQTQERPALRRPATTDALPAGELPSQERAPRTEQRPSNEQRPQERRTAPRDNSREVSRETPRDVPTPAAKSAEDLKSILRTMTAASSNEKKPSSPTQQTRQHVSASTNTSAPLKSVLADVLKKAQSIEAVSTAPISQTSPSVAAPADVPVAPAPAPVPAPSPAKAKPFEVPEDTLKALFKEQ